MSWKNIKGQILSVSILVVLINGSSLALWEPGDGHKMHLPQLPDPTGMDVAAEYDYKEWCWLSWGTARALADDWQCAETGPVKDIHFWGSWKGDHVGTVGTIAAGIFADDGGLPGALLWHDFFDVTQFHVVDAGSGDQGWLDPYDPLYIEHDHTEYYQYNIPVIADPFEQEAGNTYWLGLSINFEGCEWGWKTSLNPWGSEAVYLTNMLEAVPEWDWLGISSVDPPGERVDMAFVITPEPTTILLLSLGGGLLLRRRKKKVRRGSL